ncbi:MAG: N-6 DNA methylase [Polyangiaceae bacterium]|nr:N-6 DNA methylase [Polyangiaceae bacterium]
MTVSKPEVLPYLKNKGRLLEVAKKTPQNGVANHARASFTRAKLERIFVDARDVTVDHLLGLYQLNELKALCRGRDLSDTGRRKADLVERILGREPLEDGEVPAGEVKPPGAIKEDLAKLVVSVADKFGSNRHGFAERLLAAYGTAGDSLDGVDLGGTVSYVSQGHRTKRKLILRWEDRGVLMDVLALDANLDAEWNGYLAMCLQMRRVPQFVVLTNLRDVHLYDTKWKRERPRLVFNIADWPKHAESFAFFGRDWVHGTEIAIRDQDKVSKEVAELVGRLFRSLVAGHCKGEDERDGPKRLEVTRFVLQCITTMFAEDIGLLPEGVFTKLLYAATGDERPEIRLEELFRWMATPVEKRGHPEIRYFNGGVFEDPVVVHLDGKQLYALTRAAEARWSEVDPYIFGSFFESIMNPEKRRETGAHYTSVDDIMKVVGPTVVQPWRDRVNYAESLAELEQTREDLHKYRVLDPACGSGNFLYVAFRELYRLETELIQRIHKFSKGAKKVVWSHGISTENFFGIEINRFAVELTKTTLNIAKKLAFDERCQHMKEFSTQLGLDFFDPTLPLDNLDDNIRCDDAIFCDWQQCDAIVGNPPYLGGTKIRAVMGADYYSKLGERFPEVNLRADLVSYWFRRAHDSLRDGGRAGLVATNSIREGHTRANSTAYVLSNGGTITDAVSSQEWSGEASVFVSIVNWVKTENALGPHRLVVEGKVYERDAIHPHLGLSVDLSEASPLKTNNRRCTQGITLGHAGYRASALETERLMRDPAAAAVVRPFTGGTGLMTSSVDEWAVDLNSKETLKEAKTAGAAFDFLEDRVRDFVVELAEKETRHARWASRWWRFKWPRDGFLRDLGELRRLIAVPRTSARGIFVFVDAKFVVNDSCYLFALDDDYSFGILQSSIHWSWAQAVGSRTKSDTRYDKKIWQSFPWPQEAGLSELVAVAEASRVLRATREAVMREKGCHLRRAYQNADAVGPNHPIHVAHSNLNRAVRAAYQMPDGQDVLEFLLELNRCLAEDEADGHAIQGPGLPDGFAAGDPRWWSEDRIQAPIPGDN